MSENKNMRELNMDEMEQVNGGDSIIDTIAGWFGKKKKKKEPEWKPPTCFRCGSTDVELTNNRTRGYCPRCGVDWWLEYFHQSPDLKP